MASWQICVKNWDRSSLVLPVSRSLGVARCSGMNTPHHIASTPICQWEVLIVDCRKRRMASRPPSFFFHQEISPSCWRWLFDETPPRQKWAHCRPRIPAQIVHEFILWISPKCCSKQSLSVNSVQCSHFKLWISLWAILLHQCAYWLATVYYFFLQKYEGVMCDVLFREPTQDKHAYWLIHWLSTMCKCAGRLLFVHTMK